MSQAAPQSIQFQRITFGDWDQRGLMKLHIAGLGWKSEHGKAVTVSVVDITQLSWTQLTPSQNELRAYMKDGSSLRFRGFTGGSADLKEIEKFVAENWKAVPGVEKLDLATSGKNWGEVEALDQALAFRIDRKTAFEVPFTGIAQCASVLANKTEVVLEFKAQEDDAPQTSSNAGNGDMLVEMRLYVPNREDAEEGETAAEELQQLIREKTSDKGVAAGTSMCIFEAVGMSTPRGRYDLEFFSTFARLHGKSYDFKINYSSIVALFDLEKDSHHRYLVIGLDPPLKQGRTSLYHLVMQPEDRDITPTVQLNDEVNALFPALKPMLDASPSGKETELVLQMMKIVSGKEPQHEGKFWSYQGNKCVKCSYKTQNDSFLFPLEDAFLCVKPPLYIPFSEIDNVAFLRADSDAGANRTFDLKVMIEDGRTDHQFASMYKQEYDRLFSFIAHKGIKIVNAEGEVVAVDLSELPEMEPPVQQMTESKRIAEAEEEGIKAAGRTKRKAAIAAEKITAAEQKRVVQESDEEDDEDFGSDDMPEEEEFDEEYEKLSMDSDDLVSSSDEDIDPEKEEKKRKEKEEKKKEKKEKHKDKEEKKKDKGSVDSEDEEREKKHKHKHKHHDKDKEKDKEEKKEKKEKHKEKDKDKEEKKEKHKDKDEKKEKHKDKEEKRKSEDSKPQKRKAEDESEEASKKKKARTDKQ